MRFAGRGRRFTCCSSIVRFANDRTASLERISRSAQPTTFTCPKEPPTSRRLPGRRWFAGAARVLGELGNRGLRFNSPVARHARPRLVAAAASQLFAAPRFLNVLSALRDLSSVPRLAGVWLRSKTHPRCDQAEPFESTQQSQNARQKLTFSGAQPGAPINARVRASTCVEQRGLCRGMARMRDAPRRCHGALKAGSRVDRRRR